MSATDTAAESTVAKMSLPTLTAMVVGWISIEWLLRVFGPTYVTFYANDGSGFRASAQIDPLPS